MSAIAISKNTRFRRLAVVAGVVLLTLPGVAGNQPVEPRSPSVQPPVFPEGPQPPRPAHHWYQIGRASWYGSLFQGQPTASGEDFDMNAMTCAHRSLPMGSLVKVTNLRNHKSVVVRVNDRGPIPANRVVDLSYAAAHFLGFSRRGTAPVRLELLSSDSQLAQMVLPRH